MKKVITTIVSVMLVSLLLVGAVFCFTGCQNKKDDSKLYVGMECGYAPFNYTQTDASNGAVKISNADGYANGYDVMIAKKIAEALGKELVIVKYKFEALIPAVNAKSLDMIIAGMSPTAERKEAIDFSDAYYTSQLVIVVRKDGAFAKATKLADFNGAKIAAQIGTFHNDALQAQASEYGILPQTPMDTFPALINALKPRLSTVTLRKSPVQKRTARQTKSLPISLLKTTLPVFRHLPKTCKSQSV
ncbi:MAG: transporter substrate-binding domain-containing protein [Clostridiales bacterium]|nr:MAG: transporter substrate-binding domain-containing protein [Clostridiales bacterium]